MNLIIILCVIIFVIVAFCVFLILLLFRKNKEYKITMQELSNDYENKTEVMQQNYTNTIQQLQEEKKAICKEYDDRIQHIQEDIENRKNQLLLMEEKELLVRIMMALNSYATRFDRLEKHLSIDEITRKNTELVHNITAKQTELEKSFVEQLVGFKASVNNNINDSELIRKLNEISAEAISGRLSCIMYNMESEISKMTSQLTNQIRTMNISLTKTLNDSELIHKLDEISAETIAGRISCIMYNMESEISKMTSQLTNQIGNMNASVTKSLNDSELPKRLDRFEYDVKGILSSDNKYNSLSEQIEELIDRVNSMKSDIEDMKPNICEGTSSYSLCSAIDDIHNSVCDRYGYDSIASNLDNILSAVQEAKEAAERAKDVVESHFY